MSHGAGHILEMIQRMRFNREQRRSQRRGFSGSESLRNYGKRDLRMKSKPRFSKEQVKQARQEINAQLARDSKRQKMYLYVFLIIGVIAIIAAIILMNNASHEDFVRLGS